MLAGGVGTFGTSLIETELKRFRFVDVCTKLHQLRALDAPMTNARLVRVLNGCLVRCRRMRALET